MKERNKYLIAIAVLLICLGMALTSTPLMETPVSNAPEIQRLRQQSDSLLRDNEKLDSLILDLNTELEDLKVEVAQKKNLIEQLKQEQDEKSKIIMDYSTDELYRFFARSGADTTKGDPR